jgi:hypothetical protein
MSQPPLDPDDLVPFESVLTLRGAEAQNRPSLIRMVEPRRGRRRFVDVHNEVIWIEDGDLAALYVLVETDKARELIEQHWPDLNHEGENLLVN